MYELHDIVEMKKTHPCGVNRLIMMPRKEFDKKMKKVLEKAGE